MVVIFKPGREMEQRVGKLKTLPNGKDQGPHRFKQRRI
jgi:hypothetical protein